MNAAVDEPDQIFNVLKAIEPFSCLDETMTRNIAADTVVKRYPRGSYVFYKGDKSQKALFIVLEGQAKVVTAAGEDQAAAGYRNPGDFFGVTVLLSDDPYPASVTASKDLTCLIISQQSFEQALGASREFAGFFTKALATRLKELYQTFMFDTSEKDFLYGQPLRKRVLEIAVPEVVTCLALDGVREVALKMNRANVSSVVVVAPNQKPIGIITEKDLVGKVLATENPNLALSAYEIMSAGLITVHPQDFIYQALFLMVKHSIKHIVVTDESQRLSGIVTVRDLVRTRNSGALTIVNRIEFQQDLSGLAEIMEEVDQLQHALLSERAYASELCTLVTELYDRVTRKVILFAEREMADEGWEMPPVKYCFINMGSAGRKEQYARTDQDNGIIYEDPPREDPEAAARHFTALGEKVVTGLERCGFKRCRGGVMANNEQWCRPLSTWRSSVNKWLARLEPGNIRNMTIFLDFRYLSGEIDLFENLKDFVTRLFQRSRHALLFMAEDDLRHRVPLNIFKQIVTERSGEYRKKINLKSTVLVHIIDCLRVFALREGIKETNTFERIHRLRERGIFIPDEAEFIEAAYETLMMFRIRDALQKIKQGLEPDNYIKPGDFSKKEQSLLKESLLVVNRLQSLASHAFRVHSP